MAKTPKLPFVVQPRLAPIKELVGSDESGKIEIERRGYLTVAEKQFVSAATSGDSALSDLHALAGRIARKVGKPQTEVFMALVGAAEGDTSYVEEFDSEISHALMSLMAYQEKHKLVVACCMLINRVDPDWTIDATLDLHPDIVDGLMLLYNQEDAKSIEALEAAANNEAADDENAGKE